MPARKIPLNYRNITGYVQSDKSGDYTNFESSLERDALILAEYDENILSFKTQPRRFDYEIEGKQRHYTPDILISYKVVITRSARHIIMSKQERRSSNERYQIYS